MTGINFTSSGIFNKNTKYKLSSIISGDNLLYSITDKSTGKIAAIRELPQLKTEFFMDKEYLTSIFEKNNLFHKNIDEVSIGILSRDFSFIPAELDSTISEKDIFSSVSIKYYSDKYKVRKRFHTDLNSYLYFLVPDILEEFMRRHYLTVSFYHANEIFAKQYDFIKSYKHLLLINLNENYLQTAIYKNGKFQQTNVYSIKTKEDILYRTIANLSNAGIPLNKADVILSGRIEEKSEIHNILYEHVKNLSFINDIPRLDFSNVFLGKPKHLFFDIYALSKCE